MTTFLSDPRQDTVVLTRGGMWSKDILADVGTVWPSGTTHTTFYDTSGGVITDLNGTVTDEKISFSNPPGETDGIPAGAGFETFLVTSDGPYKIRYGKVIRKEVGFPTAPSIVTTYQPQLFIDDFQRTNLGSKWLTVSGVTRIHNNDPVSEPSGIGPDIQGLYAKSSIRYFAPLAGDAVKSNVTLLRTGGKGKAAVLLCADQALSSYVGFLFDTSVGTSDSIGIFTGTGPDLGIGVATGDMTIKASMNTTLATYAQYTVAYDDQSNTARLFTGTDPTPTLAWTDAALVIPHGQGYRYIGFAFAADLVAGGPEFTDWSAQDAVGGI